MPSILRTYKLHHAKQASALVRSRGCIDNREYTVVLIKNKRSGQLHRRAVGQIADCFNLTRIIYR